MLISFSLKLSLKCPSCRGPMPVNGVTDRLWCQRCGLPHELPLDYWTRRFGPEVFGAAFDMAEGKQDHLDQIGGSEAQWVWGKRQPRCAHCDQQLDLEAIRKAADSGGFDCPGCGVRIRVREATELARGLLPAARYLVHEQIPGDPGTPAPAARTVLFGCLGCGAAIEVDGASRALLCDHCGASNYIPDGLWLALRPPATMSWFYLVAELGQADIEAMRYAPRSEACRADASNADLSPDACRLIARALDADARSRLALNNATPAEVLADLARDESSTVRENVARNHNTPPDALRGLITDHRARVHLAMNPGTPADTLRQLARSDDTRVRSWAGSHDNTPADALDLLAADRDAHVAEQARSRGGGAAWNAVKKEREALEARRSTIVVTLHLSGMLLIVFSVVLLILLAQPS